MYVTLNIVRKDYKSINILLLLLFLIIYLKNQLLIYILWCSRVFPLAASRREITDKARGKETLLN